MLKSSFDAGESTSAPASKSRKENLQAVLLELLQTLAQQDYQFTTVTPLTHERFFARQAEAGETLQDIFGWNLPFKLDSLSPPLRRLILEAGLAQNVGECFKSTVRISSLGNDLLLHSAFPTSTADAVFFGPDTYRFARFIRQTLTQKNTPDSMPNNKPLRVLDIGCGSGAGGLAVARALSQNEIDLTLNDINALALDYARVNIKAAAVAAHFLAGDIFTTRLGKFDLVISNPPYMKDCAGRAYRNGGERLGLDFSIRLVQHAVNHLAPGGKLLLYTGVAMTTYSDPFLEELQSLLATKYYQWSYEEIDPDIFSEELAQPAYAGAYRIAAVGLIVERLS